TSLPVIARPDAEDMLVIGFGGGVALEGVPPSIRSVDAVELEPEVIAANRALRGKRNIDPLEDPRVNIVINDARNALRLTNKSYDIVVSQPSHPWTAGASHLFTREFVADVKSHLNQDGVFVQWMNSEFVEEELLRTLAATLLSEFPNVRLYQPAAQVLVFLSSEGQLDLELQVARTGQPFTDDVMHYSRLGLNSVEDLLAALLLDHEGIEEFAADAPISTDNINRMATDSRSRADGLYLNDVLRILLPYDPVTRRGSWVYTLLNDQINFGYLAQRMMRMSQQTRVTKLAEINPRTSSQLLIYGMAYNVSGQFERGRAAFEAALRADPNNAQARYMLIRDQLATLNTESASEETRSIASQLPDSASAVIAGWGYGAEQNYPAMAQLDPVLNRTRITDLWYPEAVRLRAEWRTSVSSDRERFAFDALRLIDRTVVINPNRDLFLLRLLAGIAMNDDDIATESARFVLSYVDSELGAIQSQGGTLPTADLGNSLRNVNAIVQHLESDDLTGDPDRAADVLRSARTTLRNLQNYANAL
ncbi:MAG TPA: fused MFS/spermidine synthase, partial [Gammaproteobacteria bacterium]